MALNRPDTRVDISHSKDAWQVSVIVDDHSEHRSFRTEAEAREYARNRLEQLRPSKSEVQLS